MDEKELQAVAEALNQLREGSTVSAETLAKLGGTAQSANKALEGYTKKILGATSAIGGMARQVSDGEGSFKSLGGTISGLLGVVGKLAGALPLVGGAARALAEGVGEAAKFVLDQLDTMAKNYQTLGDASAGAADGVDGLLRQFNNLGNYSLPAFTKAVRTNVQGISALGGTAALGAEELAKVSGVLTTGDTARKFLKLGIGLESVGDATAEYLANMSRYGLTQGSTTEELTKKTQNYILEVDKIARLTGQTREAQAKEAQKSLADSRFRAKIAEMRANGQGKQAEELQRYVDGLGGALGDAARATVTGTYLTQQAAEADIVLNGAIRRNIDAIQAGTKATDSIADTQEAAAQGARQFGTLFKFGRDLGGVGTQVFDTEALLLRRKELEAQGLSRADAIAKAQQEQMEASGKTTQEFTDAQLATAGASKNLQSLGFSLATYAVPAVNKFAGALEKVTGFVNEKIGIGGKYSTPAGVDRGAAGGPRAAESGRQVLGTDQSRAQAEQYLGKKMSDAEFSALIKATHAESAAGKKASQQEQAMIMASILNRARTDQGGIMGALYAKNQFQAVTGTATNRNQPSLEYLKGPAGERLKSIEGAAALLSGVSKSQKDFTAANAGAYGPGTNIGYRNQMLKEGGVIVGDTVFRTAPTSGYKNQLEGTNYNSAGAGTQAQGQQAQAQQAEKNSIMGLAQVLDEIAYNTRNGAREQQKTNRLAS
jgi:hypothetical protein